jgi:hypothetical protein
MKTEKNGVFWDVTPCGSCKNRRFGGTSRLHHQGDKNRSTRKNSSCNLQPTHAAKKYQVSRVRRLLVTASAVPSSLILVTLMKEALPPKRPFLQEPHGVTSQKTPFFIITAVKTSNLTHMKTISKRKEFTLPRRVLFRLPRS